MDYSVMEQYWIWLSAVDGIGPRRFYQLLSAYQDARDVWERAGEDGMRFLGQKALSALIAARSQLGFYQLFARLQESGVRAITRLSADYPRRLAATVDPPPTLYAIGDADLNAEKSLAVVGSRRCTRDGARAAREFSEKLAREGVTIVSGLAAGVDGAAHEGALKADGKTIAVLGCGADVVYPPEHGRLYREILEKGGAVVSEYPPGTPPLASHFPARNRIISGLSDALLLIEGAKKSGAMITVNCALEQNREVFALPGSIYSPMSFHPNQLIVDGAPPATCAWDILEYMRWGARPSAGGAEKPGIEMDADERAVVDPLRKQSLTVTELAQITGFTSQRLFSLLTMLELRGIISKQPGGEYRADQ